MEDVEGIPDEVLFPGHIEWGRPGVIGAVVSGEIDLRDAITGTWPVKDDGVTMAYAGPAWATHEIATSPLEFPVRQTVLASPDDMTEADAEALMATAGKVLSRIKTMKEAIGEDHEDGAVIRFAAVHGRRTYSYAGHRTGGLWYLTGARAPQAQTWEQLRAWAWNNGVRSVEVLAASWPQPEKDEDMQERHDPDVQA